MVAAPLKSVQSRLEAVLRRQFQPERLTVSDFSAAHAGHAGSRPGGETHFRVEIVAAAFAGRGRLERHRLVMDAARELLRDEIHALSIEAAAPGETRGEQG
jgi:BolA protein